LKNYPEFPYIYSMDTEDVMETTGVEYVIKIPNIQTKCNNKIRTQINTVKITQKSLT
jgi:hypothetical protein